MGHDNRDPVQFRDIPMSSDKVLSGCIRIQVGAGNGEYDWVRIYATVARTDNPDADEFNLREQLACGVSNQIRRTFAPGTE